MRMGSLQRRRTTSKVPKPWPEPGKPQLILSSRQRSCRLLPQDASCRAELCLVWNPSWLSRSNPRLLTLLNVLIKQLSSHAKLTYGSLGQTRRRFLSWLMCGHHARVSMLISNSCWGGPD